MADQRPKLDPGSLWCLAEAHWWTRRPALVTDQAVFGEVGRNAYKVAQQCDHCESLRFRVVSKASGEFLYPPKYDHSPQFDEALAAKLTKAEARALYYAATEPPAAARTPSRRRGSTSLARKTANREELVAV
jgi:hypothetical protein